MKLPDARKVNHAEQAILNRLLELPFPGSDTIAEQLRKVLVVPIDDNGTLDFLIEAEAENLYGTTIHLELHVIDGITRGLHVYKEDSSRVIRMPEPSEFRIFSPP